MKKKGEPKKGRFLSINKYDILCMIQMVKAMDLHSESAATFFFGFYIKL